MNKFVIQSRLLGPGFRWENYWEFENAQDAANTLPWLIANRRGSEYRIAKL